MKEDVGAKAQKILDDARKQAQQIRDEAKKAGDLMVSLLGSKRLKPSEIDQLRCLLESAKRESDAKKGE